MGLYRLTGVKITSCQCWRFEKNSADRLTPGYPRSNRPIGRIFFKPPTLTACNFDASWPTETHSTSLERSQPLQQDLVALIHRNYDSCSQWPTFICNGESMRSFICRQASIESLSDGRNILNIHSISNSFVTFAILWAIEYWLDTEGSASSYLCLKLHHSIFYTATLCFITYRSLKGKCF